MKGINNRQKMIVKPRESVQKYLSQQKNLQKLNATGAKKQVEGFLRKKK